MFVHLSVSKSKVLLFFGTVNFNLVSVCGLHLADVQIKWYIDMFHDLSRRNFVRALVLCIGVALVYTLSVFVSCQSTSIDTTWSSQNFFYCNFTKLCRDDLWQWTNLPKCLSHVVCCLSRSQALSGTVSKLHKWFRSIS